MIVDKLLTNLRILNVELHDRLLIIHAVLRHQTVYVEMQSFLQRFFKNSINGQYALYNVNCTVANAQLGKYFQSDDFVDYFETEYNIDFDLVKQLNYIANEHKHSNIVSYVESDVRNYYRIIYELSAQYIEKLLNIKVPAFSNAIIDEIIKDTDLDSLRLQIKTLESEIAEKIAEINNNKGNEQENNSLRVELDGLSEILKEKENVVAKLEEQVQELSSHNEYENNTLLGFRLSPQDVFSTNFYEKAIKAKRAGDYSYALHIYKEVFFANNCAYDYDLLNAIMKVALLAKKFDLCKAIIYAMMHYEINYFLKNTDKDNSTINTMMLMSQIDSAMKNNRFFANRFYEDISEKKIPFFFIVGSYSVRLATYYFFTLCASDNYIEETDDYGMYTAAVNAYFYLVQHGEFANDRDRECVDDIERSIRKGESLYDLTLEIMSNIQFEEINNLAVVSIYKIKELMEEL